MPIQISKQKVRKLNNQHQYCLIFQSSLYQRLTPLIVCTRMCTPVELIWIYYMGTSIQTKERPNISHS